LAEVQQPVRLVHITTVPMSLGFLVGQAEYARQRDVEMHAISSPGERLDSFGEQEHVPVYAVEMPRRITPLKDLGALWQIVRHLRRIRPHIVHAHTPKGGLLGTIAAWLARVPVRIYHMRGLPLATATGPKRTLLTWSEKVASGLSHETLSVSHSIRDMALELGLCPAGKIKVLLKGSGQGVDADGKFNPATIAQSARAEVRAKYGIPSDALVLGFVGRIVRDKGVVELVEAWQRLRDEFPHLHLLVVGPFEPQDPVPAAVEDTLRTDPRVHLTGENWDTPPLYAAMDIVALPSYREGFPNVPLEAASMGLSVVATRVAGCIDAVADGETGTLVPAKDSQALAEAVRAYVSDGDLRSRHGLAGRRRVEQYFRREVIWRAIYEEYAELLQKAGLPVPGVDDGPGAADGPEGV